VRRGRLTIAAGLSCLLAVAASVQAEPIWVLRFPDKAICDAFKDKGTQPALAEGRAKRDIGKAPIEYRYTDVALDVGNLEYGNRTGFSPPWTR